MRQARPFPQRAHDTHRCSVAVVGLGAVGGAVAAFLGEAGRHDVVACTRTPIDRLTLERHGESIDASIRSLARPDDAAPVDWVLLCVKVTDVQAAAPWLARLCQSGTRVAALQNGIGHADRLAPLVGAAVIVPTVVYFNAERVATDRVRFGHAARHDLAVARDRHGAALVDLLAGTPLQTLSSDDLDTLAWRKLLLNAVANPLTALTMRRLAVFERDDIRALSLGLLEEGVLVGRAEGAQLAPDEAPSILDALLAYPPGASTSMYFDRAAGRPLEIEALTGAIVAAGKRHGIRTPLNEAVLALLQAADVGTAAAATAAGARAVT